MKQPVAIVEHYPKTAGNDDDGFIYADTANLITSYFNLGVNFGTEKRKDKAQFSLLNHKQLNDDGSFHFSQGSDFDIGIKDLIKVYAFDQSELSSGSNFDTLTTAQKNNFLLMSAFVKSFDYDSEQSGAAFVFNCYNRTEVLLNSFMFAPYNEGEQVPNMIVDSITKIANFNLNDRVFAYKDYSGNTSPGSRGTYDHTGNSVSVTRRVGSGIETVPYGFIHAYKKGAYKTDGTGTLKDGTGGDPDYTTTVPSDFLFSDIEFVETYKPFIQHLEELSTPEFTDDSNGGIYVAFVDEDDNLHWEPKSADITDTLKEYEHSSISLSKDVDDVVNAVIVNCGTDPNQNGILALSYNTSSMGENGARWKYVAKVDIAEEVFKKERESGTYVTDDGVTISTGQNAVIDSNYIISDDGYPVDQVGSGFPASDWIIQTTGSDAFGDWEYSAGSSIVTSRKGYKEYFRRVCRRIGEKRGTKITDFSDNPRFKGNWELENGDRSFGGNQLLKLVVPSIGIEEADDIKLRITTVNHNFDEGWRTTLEIEEDSDERLIV